MKRLFILFFLPLFINNSQGASSEKNINDTVLYQRLVDNPYNLIVIEACINNENSGNFVLDTGMGNNIIIDSTFFYNNIDTTNLVRVKPDFKMWYWQAFYKGELNIAFGNCTISTNKIEVRNNNMYKFGKDRNLTGLIDVRAFRNKITYVDFDNERIAFSDTLIADSSYTAIPMKPPRVLSDVNPYQRFIEIGGFTNKSGQKKHGLFLLDTGHWRTGIQLKRGYAKNLMKGKLTDKEDCWMWRIDNMNIGKITINKVPVRFVKEDLADRYDALSGGDGVSGMVLIKRFNLIIDYKENILYIKPNKWFFLKN
jgi:hypothetical protein